MSSYIQNINDMPLDILCLVEKQVKEKRSKNYWKFRLYETIKDITEQGIHLIVRWYPDGGLCPTPYFIHEYDCCLNDEIASPRTPRGPPPPRTPRGPPPPMTPPLDDYDDQDLSDSD
tara:strand:- start:42 stop:392 length:351 start_codon:yes stop_codon:yes gene_type:complete